MDMVLTLAVLGTVIGANNLAVSLALGSLGGQAHQARILGTFAFYEFSVPLAGIWLGQQSARVIAAWSWWLGPLLLAGLGLVTLVSAFRARGDRRALAESMTSWRGIAGLGAGLSVDNLVAGFSLGLGGMPPLLLAVTIMCFSVVFAWVGLRVGRTASRNLERYAAGLAGILLIGLAAALLAGWI